MDDNDIPPARDLDADGTWRRGAAGRPGFDIVVVAASLGGPNAVATVLGGLPRDFPAAVVIAQHRADGHPSYLAGQLQRRTSLPVVDARHEAPVLPGAVYVAPAGQHLLLRPDRSFALSLAERHQYARPSADLLFASAAECYRERAIAVVLTGRLQDGSAGAWAVKALSGRVLAQDPATCEAPDMPSAAIRSGCVDFVVPLDRIANVLVALTMSHGAPALFRVPAAASLARARHLWTA